MTERLTGALNVFYQNGEQVRVLQPDIKGLRARCGLSLEGVAERVGMTRANIHKLERGDRGKRGLPPETAAKFMCAFDVSFLELFPEAPFAPHIWTPEELRAAISDLKEGEISLSEISRQTGMPTYTLNNIMNGKRKIAIEDNLIFTEYFGVPAPKDFRAKEINGAFTLELIGDIAPVKTEYKPQPLDPEKIMADAEKLAKKNVVELRRGVRFTQTESPKTIEQQRLSPQDDQRKPQPVATVPKVRDMDAALMQPAQVPTMPILTMEMNDAGHFMVTDEVATEIPIPRGLERVRGIFGVYVYSPDMMPRYSPGDIVVINPHKPPREGDHVLIVTKNNIVHIRHLVRYLRGAEAGIRVERYSPDGEYDIPQDKIKRLYTIEALIQG